MPKPIRILVVDDHPALRAGVVAMLDAFENRFDVVAEAGDAEEAYSHAMRLVPDVVLTDYDLGKGKSTGIDLIGRLQMSQPGIRHMLISAFVDDEFLLLAQSSGASAFLEKSTDASDLARAIESVASGFLHFPLRLPIVQAKRHGEPKLTPREAELIPFIAQGLSAKNIAIEISKGKIKPVSVRTVEVHKGNIKQKFHLKSPSALTAFAIDYCQSRRIPYKSAKQ